MSIASVKSLACGQQASVDVI